MCGSGGQLGHGVQDYPHSHPDQVSRADGYITGTPQHSNLPLFSPSHIVQSCLRDPHEIVGGVSCGRMGQWFGGGGRHSRQTAELSALAGIEVTSNTGAGHCVCVCTSERVSVRWQGELGTCCIFVCLEAKEKKRKDCCPSFTSLSPKSQACAKC